MPSNTCHPAPELISGDSVVLKNLLIPKEKSEGDLEYRASFNDSELTHRTGYFDNGNSGDKNFTFAVFGLDSISVIAK
jgi:hypothetical protein